MGLFSFGGSRSRSRSQSRGTSSSSSQGTSSSRQGSMGGSVSGGSSISRSRSGSRGTSRQTIAFEDVFARLFGNAEDVAGSLDASMLTDAANQLFGAGTDFIDMIGGDAGSAFLESRLGAGDELLNEQIGLLQEDVGRLFSEELNPAIEAEAVAGGALGGGRQGVAQAGAIDTAAREFRRGAKALRSEDMSRKDAIAQQLMQQNMMKSQTGISALPQLLALAESQMSAEFLPEMMLAQILGPMQALTESEQSSFGTSFADAVDFARAFSESFGESESQQSSRSRAEQSSSSSSRSGSFSLGFG